MTAPSWPDVQPDRVRIREVGPRDGLQIEPTVIPTADKVVIVNALSASGLDTIQATSAVHPRAVPQLADAEELMAGIERLPGVRYSVLVPNLRGAQRAAVMAADEWDLMLSVTDAHSRANANRGTWEAFDALVRSSPWPTGRGWTSSAEWPPPWAALSRAESPTPGCTRWPSAIAISASGNCPSLTPSAQRTRHWSKMS